MSDILLAAGLDVDCDRASERFLWTPSTKRWTGQSADLQWAATHVTMPDLWRPAFDPVSGTRALVAGRFAFEETEWTSAEQLPYDGGLAARLVLKRWLSENAPKVEQLNGSGLAVIIDEKARELHVWTDRLGFYPIYAWKGGGFLISSHPDVAAEVLAASGRPLQFDALTMAEFLRTGTAIHPHTYWRGVNQLDAGTHFVFSYDGVTSLKSSSRYWRPAYFDQPYLEDRREIVERLEAALRSAIRRRTLPRLGKVALMLSAGADSRAALFGACNPSAVTCFTFYDEPNAEFRGAQSLANAVGARHIAHQRSQDYYFEHTPEAVRMAGGMWSMDSAHYGGVLDRIWSEGTSVVLTGCYADYLLKGLAYNRRHRMLFGRPIPLYKPVPYADQWYQAFCEITLAYSERVQERIDSYYRPARSSQANAASVAEYLRLAPIIREADAMGRHTLRCATGHDFFMADAEVLDLAGRISPAQKMNGIPFGMAVGRITGDLGRSVLNNNHSAPVGATETHRVAGFLTASLRRKIAGRGGGQPYERDPNSIATVGSWPHFPRVIQKSERLREWYAAQAAEQKELLFEILGHERREWSLDDWAARDTTLFMRYHTASLWLSQQPQALGAIARD